MATQPDIEDTPEDDILDLEEEQIIEDEPEEQAEEPEEPAEEEAFVGFDDEPEAPPENDLVKHLRQQIRDRDRRLAEAAKTAPAEPEIVVGDRPKPADFDYDDDRFDEALDAWEARKAAKAKQDDKRARAEQSQQEQWAKVTENYATQKKALRFPDVQEAEQRVLDTLSGTTQALIAKHADNAALFIYAAGKSPAKLAELARIDAEGDPFAVVKAVTKMEAMLQKPRTTARPPAPDTPVRGKVIAAGSADKMLDKLEKEAERTGDRSKVIAHKAAMKKGNNK
jgi:hypothetical protein